MIAAVRGLLTEDHDDANRRKVGELEGRVVFDHVNFEYVPGVPVLQDTVSALTELFPAFSRLRLMRQWAGIVDITPDTTPLLGKTPVEGLYISGGWGTGGYKAIPAGGDTMAHTIAHDSPHPLITSFGLDRFASGALIDEGAASGVAH